MKYCILFIGLILTVFSFSQEIKIGVLRHYAVKKIEFTFKSGTFKLLQDDSEILQFVEGDVISFQSTGSNVSFVYNGISHVGKSFRIIPLDTNQITYLNCKIPKVKSRSYYDGYEISSSNGRLKIINIVDMEHYLGGVIESEGGGGKHLEYYKVQALMSRTYAYKNINRHKKDGFSLCDEVHCQAYHNRLIYTKEIDCAVYATKGEVLEDQKNRLITSYFSANCGGETCEASYIWNNNVDYLVPFRDTFCIHTKQANWEERVNKDQWLGYLKKQFGVNNTKIPDLENLVSEFNQNDFRKAFYIHPSLGIPLRDLRIKFKLKSTFFNTRIEGDEVVITGRGFGHGVGLCQEGAMSMARHGYTYEQIALFYFENVQIVNRLRKLYFLDTENDPTFFH